MLLLVAMIVIMPVLAPFTRDLSGRALRNGLFEGMGILLLVILLSRLELRGGLAQVRFLARSGVNAPLLAFLLWATVAALWATRAASPVDRALAIAELLRLGSGAVIYFAVALHIERRAQLSLLIDCLLGAVIFLLGYAFLFQGSEAGSGARLSSVFPSAHHLSAILTVLLPLLASLALGGEDRARRLVAITAAILAAAGLVLCLERSAWIAVIVGFILLLLLADRTAPAVRSRQQWRATLAVVATGVLVTIGFFAVTGVDAFVADHAHRVTTAIQGRDSSFAWREQKWRGTLAMVRQRPLMGWGPGQYVLHGYDYTHLGSPVTEVRRYGASFEDMAYDEYLQTAAEVGLPGLALYLLMLASFFSKAGRALRRLPGGLRRTVLLGSMAGIAAQMVDAMANGSWRYTECTVFFWLVLGLGTAAIRMAYQGPAAATAGRDQPAAEALDRPRPHQRLPVSH